MRYIPIFLDVAARKCVVIGGGEVAARKAESLLDAGAHVTIVSARLSPATQTVVAAGRVTHVARDYQAGDIAGSALVYAATDDPKANRDVAAEALALGIPINVADVPDLCTFIAPAVVRRGALQIAISTSGASPAFAARLRRELEDQFGVEYAIVLELLQAARKRLRAEELDPGARMRRLKDLANSRLLDAVRSGDRDSVDGILAAHLGPGITMSVLGIDPASLGAAAGTRHASN